MDMKISYGNNCQVSCLILFLSINISYSGDSIKFYISYYYLVLSTHCVTHF